MLTETISLSIKRSPSEPTATDAWRQYSVPVIAASMSVLDALMWAQRNADPSLAFRSACRVGMCGTCGVAVNGREGLACRTLVSRVIGDGEIRVEPVRHVPVVRDLVTDMSSFHAKAQAVAPNTEYAGAGTPGVFTDSRQAIQAQRECIYCGLCYSACSVVGLDPGFAGPAALNRAFVAASDDRNELADDVLGHVANEHGLWRCHDLYECTAVCPKGISPTLAIQRLKRRVTTHKLKRAFRIGR
ncbi:MAG: succinate dehydrogenase/fumarate reductase iron-sulfur subunit [SAR202 cluster bacterium]|jgi:succinate dehydrogenase/fumarate reductase iron-sulfur protein|nr:succinate dehydrogenase/fumarate reductase iron-sulfur subunit [SAR202 cluster bacterium]